MSARILLSLLLAVLMATSATANPERWKREWPDTDFTRSSVADWGEIVSGGPPRDGIPALDSPTFRKAGEETRIADAEPVVTLELPGATPRAYPLRYLTWHEIVNDRVGGIPVAVTYCPLCNSGIVYDRRLDDRVLSFGVTGKLRHSDLVMYDRETESWWQQALGTAIVGEMQGATLDQIPAWVESWESFRSRNPDGIVMAQPTGHRRSYGANPYVGYDSAARPFMYDGDQPPHGIDPLARVVRVGDRAWPLARLREAGEIEEDGVVLSWDEGMASALDTQEIASGRDVGAVRVRDASGADLPHDLPFAFAFQAFWPEGRWMLGD